MSVGKDGDAPLRGLDASALKAYAHPLRLRMIQYLNDHGSATATELARHLDQSTGQTSYHLRQLARHGLIEDDPDRGKGRERWWRPTRFHVDAATLRDDPALEPAARLLLTSVAQARAATLDRWIRSATEAPPEWVDAAMHSQSTLLLAPDEAAELAEALLAVVSRYMERSASRGAQAPVPAERQRVRVYIDAFPLLGADHREASTAPPT